MSTFRDPLALFQAAVAAVNAEDWLSAAALCDPVSLRAFQRALAEQFAPREPREQVTVEWFMKHSPDMPRDVAEYYVAQTRQRTDPASRLAEEFPDVVSVAALLKLSPARAFATWLEGRSIRRQLERMADTGRISKETVENYSAAGEPAYSYVARGVVPDGASVSHVVFRRDFGAEDPSSEPMAQWLAARPADEQHFARELWQRSHPQVATCRRQGDGTWRLIADYSFLHIGSLSVGEVGDGEADTAADA